MSGVTMSMVNELTELVISKINAKREKILQKFEVSLKRLTAEAYDRKLKELKIDKLRTQYDSMKAEIATLEALVSEKETKCRDIIDQSIRVLEHNDKKWKIYEKYRYGEDRFISMLRTIENDVEKDVIDAHHEVGPVISELEEVRDSVREKLLLANSNAAVRDLIQDILKSLEDIVATE